MCDGNGEGVCGEGSGDDGGGLARGDLWDGGDRDVGVGRGEEGGGKGGGGGEGGRWREVSG